MNNLISRYYKFLVILVLLWSFVTRVWHVDLPVTYVFDEVYHAVTAKLMARNDVRGFEWWNPEPEPSTAVDWLHPPLAKYTQALGMLALGENPLGWRISSVIFGVLVVFMTLKLAEALFERKDVSLLAAFLVSLDGLTLVQSRIAMNDIHVTFFILLTFYFYVLHLKERANSSKFIWLTGLASGLAMGSKWSGFYALAAVGCVEAIYWIKGWISDSWRTSSTIRTQVFQALRAAGALVVLPVLIYVASYGLMFAQGKTLVCSHQEEIQGECYYTKMFWTKADETDPEAKPFFEGYVSHFVMLHRQTWWYQTHLEAVHSYQSRPWQWFLNTKPVWMSVEYAEGQRADIYNVGNPLLFWLADISLVLTLILLVRFMVRDKNSSDEIAQTHTYSRFSFLITAYLFVWIFWEFSPRIMFFYHYLPAVPLMSINLACWLIKLGGKSKWGKLSAGFLVAMIALTFVAWYPHWTGQMVANEVKEKLYFALPSWK